MKRILPARLAAGLPAGLPAGLRVGLPAALLAACGSAALAQPYNPASPNVRISQVYVFGGNVGTNPVPTWRNDFIELFNPTQRTVDLSSWAIYAASATAANTWVKTPLPGGLVIGPGQYVLVSVPGGNNAASPTLPTFDAQSNFGLGTTGSKIALVSSQTPVLAGVNPQSPFIVDLVGTNTTATSFEGSPFPSPGSLVLSVTRSNPCVDTNNNANDFSLTTPAPRSLASPATPCAASPLDLTVVASGPATNVTQLGEPIVFDIGVDNLGTNLAGTARATLTVVFPSTVNYWSSSVGGVYNAATRTLTAPLPIIEGAPFRLPIQVTGLSAANGSAPLRVSVSTTDAETSLANNSTTAPVTISELASMSVALTSSQADCSAPLAVGSSLSYTVTLTNAGPNSASLPVATIALPSNAAYQLSSSASVGTLTQNAGVVTWSGPTVAPGASRTATINMTLTADGVARGEATVTSASFDSDLSDNTARVSNIVPKTNLGFPLVVTSVEGHPTNSVPGTFFATYGGANPFYRPFPSPDGTKFVMRVTASGGAGDVLLSGETNQLSPNLTFQARQGTTDVGGGIAELIDPYIAINDAGDFAFSTNTSSSFGTDEVVAKGNIATPDFFTVITREGDSVTALSPAAVTFGATSNLAGLTNSGEVAVVTTLAGDGIVATGTGPARNDAAIIRGSSSGTLVLQKGVTVPGNQLAGPGNATYSFIEGGGAEWRVSTISANGAHSLVTGTINTGDSANNEVVVVDNNVVIQEGAAIPGSGLSDLVYSFVYTHMDADANWGAYGRFSVAGQPTLGGFGWAVRNGQLLASHGSPIFAGATETFSGNTVNPALPQTFFLLTARGSDFVLGGVTNNPDTYRNSVLVHNNTTLLAREGDPIDLDGNGIADDDAYIADFRDDRAFITGDRKLWVMVDVATRSGICNASGGATPGTPGIIGSAIIVIDLPPAATFCTADIAGGGELGNQPDGSVDGSDFIAFINSFGIGDAAVDPAADIVGGGASGDEPDGTIDGSDFIAFINAFAAGC